MSKPLHSQQTPSRESRRFRWNGNPMGVICACILLALTSVVGSAVAANLPVHTPEWNTDGRDVSYGVVDDLATETNDAGIARNNPAYPYFHCRRGVAQDFDRVEFLESDADLFFSPLSGANQAERQENLFVMRRPKGSSVPTNAPWLVFNGSGWLVAGGQNTMWPWSGVNAQWASNEVVLVDVPQDDYYLFRYLHFRNTLYDEFGQKPVDETTRKAIIVVHGWNTDSGQSFTGEWATLLQQLETVEGDRLRERGWALIKYDWKEDADTGFLFSEYPSSAAAAGKATASDPGLEFDPTLGTHNATEAAEASHTHGQHLGELLAALAPEIEKVHILASSAGSWCARTAARTLLAESQAMVQVTLLDPFMPKEGGVDANVPGQSVLGRDVMGRLESVPGNERIWLLENYFTFRDETNFLGLNPGATSQVFDWGNRGVNFQIDWQDSGGTWHYDYHSAPILMYAQTITDTVDSPPGADWNAVGWKWSMTRYDIHPLNPRPEVLVNDSHLVQTAVQGETATLTLSLDPADQAGVNADFWLVFFYRPDAATPWNVAIFDQFQAPLFDLPPLAMDLDTAGFPTGEFMFYWAVDMAPNNAFDGDQAFFDIAFLTVVP